MTGTVIQRQVIFSPTRTTVEKGQVRGAQRSVEGQLSVEEMNTEDLQCQNDVLRESIAMADAVIQSVLDGEGLAVIGQVVFGYANAEVAFLTCDLQTMAGSPSPSWLEDCLPLIKRALANYRPDQFKTAMTLGLGQRWLSLRAVVAGRDHAGWICLLTREQPGHLQKFAITQAAMASALNYWSDAALAEFVLIFWVE